MSLNQPVGNLVITLEPAMRRDSLDGAFQVVGQAQITPPWGQPNCAVTTVRAQVEEIPALHALSLSDCAAGVAMRVERKPASVAVVSGQ